MFDEKRIADEIRADLDGIVEAWRKRRGRAVEEEGFERLAVAMERVTLVFTDFLRSPDSVETFSREGATRSLVEEIAGCQYELERDAVGVMEDFAELRKCIWRSVESRVDLRSMGGGEVAGFFVKLLQASDWVTETGLEAYEGIARREMEEAIGRAASTDLLTGLPDRDLFSRFYLPEALESHERFSLVVFDLARFSESVAAGRLALARQTLQALADTAREEMPGAVLCRFGDDEICALLPEKGTETAYKAAEKVRDRLGRQPDALQADAGIAEYPLHGRDAAALLTETLRALRMAKRVGGGGIVVAHHPGT